MSLKRIEWRHIEETQLQHIVNNTWQTIHFLDYIWVCVYVMQMVWSKVIVAKSVNYFPDITQQCSNFLVAKLLSAAAPVTVLGLLTLLKKNSLMDQIAWFEPFFVTERLR